MGIVSIMGPYLLIAGIGAAVAYFFWSNHAPAYMDTICPLTGVVYANPEEMKWVRQLTPDQFEYLQMLARVRKEKPDPSLDLETNPFEIPGPILDEDKKQKEKEKACFSRPIPRKGGFPPHDAYALKVTGSPDDFFVSTPEAVSIAYDGRTAKRVWEVKVTSGWWFNPGSQSLAIRKAAEWDAQKQRGLVVANRCDFVHVWAVTNRYVAMSLNTRWGGNPPVLYIPEK